MATYCKITYTAKLPYLTLFVIPWDQLFNSCVVEVSLLGLGPLCSTHLRVSVILKTLTLTGQESHELSENMDHNWQCCLHALCFVFWCQFLWYPPGAQFSEQQVLCDVTILCNKEREIYGKWLLAQLTMNFDRLYALCIQKHFITDHISQSAGAGIRASILNLWNDATVKTREIPLVLALCDVITLSRTCSRFTQ